MNNTHTHRLVDTKSIVPSPTNPRKHFDPAKLGELTESVKARGVLQPILVREQAGKGRFEIVCGERRWRAATAAKINQMPVMVCDLDDEAVLEVQVIENLQRDDLHPLEEAEGYDALMKLHGHTAADIAAKVGKDKSYVLKRMKLLALIPKAREAFYAGKITPSIALLLARVPDEKAQAEGLKYSQEENYDGNLPTAADVSHYLKEKFMLVLKEAPFDIHDATLTSVGACSACPKRTANQTDLFGEDMKGDDRCLDGACYKKKVDAFWLRTKAAAKQNGATVLEGREAEEAVSYNSDFVKLDEKCYEDEKRRTWRQLLGGAMKSQAVKPALARTKEGVVALVPRKEALKHSGLAVAKKLDKANEELKEQARAAKAEARLVEAIRAAKTDAFIEEVERMILQDPMSTALARLLAEGALHLAGHYHCDRVADRREAKTKGERPVDVLRKMTEHMEMAELLGMVFELCVSVGYDAEADDEIVKVVRVDFDGIERDLRARAKGDSAGARPEASPPARVGKQTKAAKGCDKDVASAKGRAPVPDSTPLAGLLENLVIPLPKGFKAQVQVAQLDGGWSAGYDASTPRQGAGVPMETRGADRKAALTWAVVGILTLLDADMGTPAAVLEQVRAWAAKHGITKADLRKAVA
jgi:ParB/RepB/Spo0J family partition protein